VSGPLPAWDPSSPVPLVALGQSAGSTSWYATLLRIAPDGALSENTAARVLVFGFEDDPPELVYDGTVGGRMTGWDPLDPIPIAMMGRVGNDWTMALARISSDGTLSDVIVDRLVVWAWRSGRPNVRYSGPPGGMLSGWNAASPQPLVLGGKLGADWFVTLARIDEDGTIAENVAESLIVWGW